MMIPRAVLRRGASLAALGFCLLVGPAAPRAEVRVSNFSVFLNDYDVTVHVVLLGAIPPTLQESLHSGIATHLRLHVEFWQHRNWGGDRRIHARTVERQVAYNVLTKEYKVSSLQGEQRDPFLTKDLREAQRVVSEVRVHNLSPATALDSKALYYVRVRSDVSLGGVNSWFSRMTGDAEETPWVQSSLLTLTRTQ